MRLARTSHSVLACLAAGLLLTSAVDSALGQCEYAKLLSSVGQEGAGFGSRVAISGDAILIGAPGEDDGQYWGVAYVFRFNGAGWAEEQRLLPSDSPVANKFGYSVAISGNTAVFGAPHDRDNGATAGAAYVFRFNGSSWVEQQKLVASDGDASDQFGYAVAIYDDTVLVGALYDEDAGPVYGSAYVFHFDGVSWVQQQKLLPPDGGENRKFGRSVALYDDTAVIGQWPEDNCEGWAYVFRFNGTSWVDEQRLPGEGGLLGIFGWSVAVHGNAVLVGAPHYEYSPHGPGAVFVFRYAGGAWNAEATLTAHDGASLDLFGGSVAIRDDTAVVGAMNQYGATGAAYVYQFDGITWAEQAKLTAADGAIGDRLGVSVAVLGDAAVCGAYGDDDNGNGSGSAYVFSLSGADCNENGLCDARDIAEGTSEDCNENAIPDECEVPPIGPPENDCNANAVPDDCEVPPIGPPENDCNANGVPDDCDIADGTSEDCNENGVPDECDVDPSDPDGNGEVSEDCNENLIPDECEPQEDCNNNGIQDICDIFNGTSEDCNRNNIPDECETNLAPIVDGFAPGSPQEADTTGGAVISFTGEGFVAEMSVIFAAGFYQVTVDPADVTVDPAGTELTVVVPSFPPGCGCALGEPLLVNVLFDNGCGQSDLFSTGSLFQYNIVSVLVSVPDDVQQAVDDAAAGTCIVLQSRENHEGPVLIGAAKSRITLTSTDPHDPGLTQLNGEYTPGGSPPPDATVTFDACGDGVCLSGLNLILGNSGAEARNGAAPVIKGCNFDDNFADSDHGGGLTITSGARPVVCGDCYFAVNTTSGSGGGIHVSEASAVIVGNRLVGNSAAGSGGGIYVSENADGLAIVDNVIWMNNYSSDPQRGGGVFWSGGTQFVPVTGLLARNDIWANSAEGPGAGVFLDLHVAPLIAANVIHENFGLSDSSYGGGIYIEEFNRHVFWICENVIYGNEAQVGAGLALMRKNEVMVERNLVFCNRAVQLGETGGQPPPPPPPFFAAGIYVFDASPIVRHNTIYANTGAGGELPGDGQSGGIHGAALATGSPQFRDNVLLNNEDWEVYSDFPLYNDRVDWNLAYDADDPDHIFSPFTMPGDNNIIADPLLNQPGCTPADPWWALGLQAGSPGVCTGSDSCNRGAVYVPECPDCEPVSCLEPGPNDCNGNGVPDPVDLLTGVSQDENWNGVPDECEFVIGDLNCDGQLNAFDIDPFVLALTDPAGYEAAFPDCDRALADINDDGTINSFDIDPFVALLTGG